MVSNLHTYLALARDSLRSAKRFATLQRRPKPDGQGFIISYDSKQKSFKHSLIAIVFAGIYFETLAHVEGSKLLGKSKYKKISKATYEDKLRALGISDKSLLLDCERFRKSRNDLVHEKAIDLRTSKATLRFAQMEAQHAVNFVLRVSKLLSPNKLLKQRPRGWSSAGWPAKRGSTSGCSGPPLRKGRLLRGRR